MDAIEKPRLKWGDDSLGMPTAAAAGRVTIIALERWRQLMAAIGVDLDPRTRREGLMVSGIDLVNSRDGRLRVGTALLRINGETRPCGRMEDAHPGLQARMRERWGGGAFAEVIEGGVIRVGDPASWESSGLNST
jgi:MOSC domain-containing protein YiiM